MIWLLAAAWVSTGRPRFFPDGTPPDPLANRKGLMGRGACFSTLFSRLRVSLLANGCRQGTRGFTVSVATMRGVGARWPRSPRVGAETRRRPDHPNARGLTETDPFHAAI